MIKVKELLAKFRKITKDAYAEAETDKLGTLRGGNTGAMYTDSRGITRVIGKCARLTHLRSLGIQGVPDERAQDMFDGGLANEHRWLEKMELAWDGKIKAEEEIPTSWRTENGTLVTGRPDIVLCSKYTLTRHEPVTYAIDGVMYEDRQAVTTAHSDPIHGLELKNVSSLWTARDVLFKGIPKMGHLLQTSHYSWQLGVPFSLCYTSTAKYPTVNKVGPNEIRWPAPDEELSEYVEHDQWGDNPPFPRAVLPFNQIYEVDAISDLEKIRYRVEGSEEWLDAPVGVQHIENYYEFVSKMGETHDLGPRPTQLKPDGSKANFRQCGSQKKPCPFAEACDKYDGGIKRGSGEGHGDYQRWLTEAKHSKKEK
jgi:hypothetical protein